jgi:predicted Fe-Mo cluster-binding NifX family protein
MKIAMPVKTAKADTAISPLFGHAKYFAFVEDGKMEIKKNPYDGGAAVVDWLLGEGVDVVITQHIGLRPFVLLAQNDVRCYYPGEGRVSIEEALKCYWAKQCEEITENNIEKFARHSHKHHHTH